MGALLPLAVEAEEVRTAAAKQVALRYSGMFGRDMQLGKDHTQKAQKGHQNYWGRYDSKAGQQPSASHQAACSAPASHPPFQSSRQIDAQMDGCGMRMPGHWARKRNSRHLRTAFHDPACVRTSLTAHVIT